MDTGQLKELLVLSLAPVAHVEQWGGSSVPELTAL